MTDTPNPTPAPDAAALVARLREEAMHNVFYVVPPYTEALLHQAADALEVQEKGLYSLLNAACAELSALREAGNRLTRHLDGIYYSADEAVQEDLAAWDALVKRKETTDDPREV